MEDWGSSETFSDGNGWLYGISLAARTGGAVLGLGREMSVTEGQDRWGNPTFTVGVLTVTAYPRHGGHGQVAISDRNFACLPWSADDLRSLSEAFAAAAVAAETKPAPGPYTLEPCDYCGGEVGFYGCRKHGTDCYIVEDDGDDDLGDDIAEAESRQGDSPDQHHCPFCKGEVFHDGREWCHVADRHRPVTSCAPAAAGG